MNHTVSGILSVIALLLGSSSLSSRAAELVPLTPETWQEYAPQGKEVDCIYGDHVLRNDKIVAVVARPVPSRNANMTVRNVGGAVIDLTQRGNSNDQLSAFYPDAAEHPPTILGCGSKTVDASADPQANCSAKGDSVHLEVKAGPRPGQPEVTTRYELTDGSPLLVVRTTYSNPHDEPLEVTLQDSLRADRGFQFGHDEPLNLFWAYDEWWDQAYGVVVEGRRTAATGGNRPILRYVQDGKATITLQPEQQHTLVRRLIPGRHLVEVKAVARTLSGEQDEPVELLVTDAAGPVEGAVVLLHHGRDRWGRGRTDQQGVLETKLPAGEYTMKVKSPAHAQVTHAFRIDGENSHREKVVLPEPGYVVAKITDAEGEPVACKVAFEGTGETPSPEFGPDTFIYGVENLRYTPDGQFRQPIRPGTYRVIVSHGPEYDAIFTEIEVQAGEETSLEGQLVRSVDTTGWVSSDFHSHSSPSGDNTSSQRGRVLNLLAEQIEFAPCTEHNRISTYVPHLKHFDAVDRVATCTGIELTGSPLPINHQNAFPLEHQPRTQDGGAPVTDSDPRVQIERLALWDEGSDKLVQGNHPNLVQMIADRDLDGEGDGGFEEMIGFMDVIEVHPPGTIFSQPEQLSKSSRQRGNTIFHWLQMLNLGYRVPGVVNTDAHYNFHGSGWLRNYLRSETDDPSQIDCMDMAHTAEHGTVVMTNGPFLEVYLQADNPGPHSAAGAGGDVRAPSGKAKLSVKVQCPNWLDVNRVQVFLNGQPSEELNYTRRTSSDRFGDQVVKFDAILPLELKEDTHVIVATVGEGLQLGPVMGPRGETEPVAVSNPIFVDVDGDGFTPNGDMLGLPLPLPDDFEPSHGHEHRHGHSH